MRACHRPQATSTGDAVVRPLRVKPEGIPVEKVQSEFRCKKKLSKKPIRIRMKMLSLPANVVEDSGRGWVKVTGDIMAPALQNMGNLVKQPTGCGEQNMAGLVPNIFLLQYMEATGQKEPILERKAKEFINLGYKRQGNYRHADGSYSIWGDKGGSQGSSWLTAFVLKSFSQAAKYIDYEELKSFIRDSYDWLIKTQLESGCFPRIGYTHSSSLKGSSSNSSLTPFIGRGALEYLTTLFFTVLALLEAFDHIPMLTYNDHIQLDVLSNAMKCMIQEHKREDLYGR